MARAAANADTAVIYMGAGDADAVVAALTAHGLKLGTPVVLVENAGRTGTSQTAGILAELPLLAARRGNGPAVIVVGEIAHALARASISELRRRQPPRSSRPLTPVAPFLRYLPSRGIPAAVPFIPHFQA